MKHPRQLWVLTGGNGAGKTTFYDRYLAKCGIIFVNADLIAKKLAPQNPESFSYQAGILAAEMRENLLREGISFCYESVFSHPSKIDFISKAKANGYKINLVYIHLLNSSLNESRVKQRVLEGGHNVPPDKIRYRIPKTLQHIKTALTLADQASVLDNSSRDRPFQEIIVVKNGKYAAKVDPLPEWAGELLPS